MRIENKMISNRPFLFILLFTTFFIFFNPIKLFAETIFYDDFSNGNMNAWTLGDSNAVNGSDYWGITYDGLYAPQPWCAMNSDGGATIWENYDNNMYAYMRQSIDLSGYENCYLKFDYYLASEECCDFLIVKINDNIVWQESGFHNWDGAPPENIDLSSYDGQAITIEFDFFSDLSINSTDWPGDGAFVDNIGVYGTPQKPDLIARNVSISENDNSVFQGDSITVYFNIMNQGNAYAGGSWQGIMLSTNTNITSSDDELATEYTGPLFAGSDTDETNYGVDIPLGVSGRRYIGILVDKNDVVDESDEYNNNSAYIAIDIPNWDKSQWVNNQGCYVGGPLAPVPFVARGNGNLSERQATQDQMEYWNMYASVFSPTTLNTGFGAPDNAINEVNTFITTQDANTIYGYNFNPSTYGVAIIQPDSAFGTFNECQDFSSGQGDTFSEIDVLINADFSSGWSTDPNNYNNALVQTTALHEIGHTLGLHHVFSLPSFGDSFSTMNYINDDSGRFVTRMDANTIRAHYPDRIQSVVDVGIFPFIFGNNQYAETYTSVSPLIVEHNDTIDISNFLIQNIGTQTASNVVITFYLSSDTIITNSDIQIATRSYSSLPVDADYDQNFSFPLPGTVPPGYYRIGAIVTVNGTEDSIGINNTFIIGRPNRELITVIGDTTPPTPNPMFWSTLPCTKSSTTINMVATTASDDSPPIAYYFDFVDSPTGGPGGSDSGWQSSTLHSDTGLGPNHQYGYRVKARDSASTPNETDYSSPTVYKYTLAVDPQADPFSNITENSIRANWSRNGNRIGTEYECENTRNGTSELTTNTYWNSIGLICGTPYSFRVRAINGDGVKTGWTSLGSQSTLSCPDTSPPTPNPMTWAIEPYETSTSYISMVATTASDPTTPITYYFDFYSSPTGGSGGNDSANWQASTYYTDSGLGANHQYGYRVRARDGNDNLTSYSSPVSYDYTDIETPSSITFGTITNNSIQAKSSNTPSGLMRGNSGLRIYNTVNGTDSNWKQNNDYWISSSLSVNTRYGFRARARNGDADETGDSYTYYRYTLANIPDVSSFSNVTQTSIRANWTANGNSSGTQYFCENSFDGTNSGWTTNTYWDSMGLSCGTSYSFRVKARNGDYVETSWTTLGSQSTQGCSEPDLSVFPLSYDFGDVSVGSFSEKDFVVSNIGYDTLHVSSFSIDGSDLDCFFIVGDGIGFDVEPGNNHIITLSFEPTIQGIKSGILRIFSDDPDEPQKDINLGGNGTGEITNLEEVKKITASDGEEGDWFSVSVCISGNIIGIGAVGDDDNGSDSGSVYIFNRDQGGIDNWGLVKKITASDGEVGDAFGTSLSITGNLMAVGAYTDDDNGTNSGSIYIYHRNQGGGDNWGMVKKIIASDGVTSGFFGYSVHLSGDTLVVGAYGDDDNGSGSGSVYIFNRDQGGINNWGLVKKITASDGEAGDAFGHSVHLSGDTLVVGAYGDEDNGNESGSVYIYHRNQGGTENWGLVKKINPTDGVALGYFGIRASISANYLVVGAYGDDDNGSLSGSAYIFNRDQGGIDNWGLVKKITASDGEVLDYFGSFVLISGNIILVGARGDDDNGSDSGSVYIFNRDQGGIDNWGLVKKITASDGAESANFGCNLSTSGDTLVVGAYGDDYNGLFSGSAYVYVVTDPGKCDFDTDGDVDASDLAVFAANFGRTDCAVGDPCEGDFDGDGHVDEPDLAVFAIDFGMTDCTTSE